MGSMITANYDSETDQIIDASPRLNNGVANSSVPVTVEKAATVKVVSAGDDVLYAQYGDVSVQHLPITHTLINPDGSLVPFTRTGASSMIDCYGVIKYISRSNDPGFWGARRVENAILLPDQSSGMTKTGRVSAVTHEPELIGPFEQRKSVYRCDCTNTGTTELWRTNSATYSRRQRTFSSWFMGDGVSQLELRFVRASDSAVLASRTFVPPAGKLQRYGVFGTPTSTSGQFRVELHGPVGAFTYWFSCPQWEETQGQSGAPNDYVPRGFADDVAPYRGCNVDGVQCFDTYNAWTIDGTTGLCTEAVTRVLIPESKLQGIDTHPSNVNRLKYSADISAAIASGDATATNVTAGAYGNSVTLGDGTLQKLVETVTNAEHKLEQVWFGAAPVDNDAITFDALVQRDRDHCYLYIVDKGGVERRAYFDLKKLVSTSLINEPTVINDVDGLPYPAYMAEIDWLPDSDVIWVSWTIPAGVGANTLKCGIGTCSAANTASFTGDTSKGLWIGARKFQRAQQRILYTQDTADTTPSGSGEARANFILSKAVGANDFTMAYAVTFNGNSRCYTRKAWDGIVYCKVDNDHRWGTCARPGPYGGGKVEDVIAGPVYDCYSGRSTINPTTGQLQEIFSVANVNNHVRGFQKQTWQISLASDKVDGHTGNIRMTVGKVVGTPDSNGQNIVDAVPIESVMYIGSVGATEPITQKRISNIKIIRRALTGPEMISAVK